jgi:hypothetical protein
MRSYSLARPRRTISVGVRRPQLPASPFQNRPLVQAQAFGESFDPDRLEVLARYEVHLDRKLERTLTMLLGLQDIRQSINRG